MWTGPLWRMLTDSYWVCLWSNGSVQCPDLLWIPAHIVVNGHFLARLNGKNTPEHGRLDLFFGKKRVHFLEIFSTWSNKQMDWGMTECTANTQWQPRKVKVHFKTIFFSSFFHPVSLIIPNIITVNHCMLIMRTFTCNLCMRK